MLNLLNHITNYWYTLTRLWIMTLLFICHMCHTVIWSWSVMIMWSNMLTVYNLTLCIRSLFFLFFCISCFIHWNEKRMIFNEITNNIPNFSPIFIKKSLLIWILKLFLCNDNQKLSKTNYKTLSKCTVWSVRCDYVIRKSYKSLS